MTKDGKSHLMILGQKMQLTRKLNVQKPEDNCV